MSANPAEEPLAFVRVLKTSEVPPGTKKAIDIAGKSILICHSDERFFAVSNLCSHAQERLECGRMQRGWIACPVHGARFELATGRPMNPPAVRPIGTFELRVVDDWIEIVPDERVNEALVRKR